MIIIVVMTYYSRRTAWLLSIHHLLYVCMALAIRTVAANKSLLGLRYIWWLKILKVALNGLIDTWHLFGFL